MYVLQAGDAISALLCRTKVCSELGLWSLYNSFCLCAVE